MHVFSSGHDESAIAGLGVPDARDKGVAAARAATAAVTTASPSTWNAATPRASISHDELSSALGHLALDARTRASAPPAVHSMGQAVDDMRGAPPPTAARVSAATARAGGTTPRASSKQRKAEAARSTASSSASSSSMASSGAESTSAQASSSGRRGRPPSQTASTVSSSEARDELSALPDDREPPRRRGHSQPVAPTFISLPPAPSPETLALVFGVTPTESGSSNRRLSLSSPTQRGLSELLAGPTTTASHSSTEDYFTGAHAVSEPSGSSRPVTGVRRPPYSPFRSYYGSTSYGQHARTRSIDQEKALLERRSPGVQAATPTMPPPLPVPDAPPLASPSASTTSTASELGTPSDGTARRRRPSEPRIRNKGVLAPHGTFSSRARRKTTRPEPEPEPTPPASADSTASASDNSGSTLRAERVDTVTALPSPSRGVLSPEDAETLREAARGGDQLASYHLGYWSGQTRDQRHHLGSREDVWGPPSPAGSVSRRSSTRVKTTSTRSSGSTASAAPDVRSLQPSPGAAGDERPARPDNDLFAAAARLAQNDKAASNWGAPELQARRSNSQREQDERDARRRRSESSASSRSAASAASATDAPRRHSENAAGPGAAAPPAATFAPPQRPHPGASELQRQQSRRIDAASRDKRHEASAARFGPAVAAERRESDSSAATSRAGGSSQPSTDDSVSTLPSSPAASTTSTRDDGWASVDAAEALAAKRAPRSFTFTKVGRLDPSGEMQTLDAIAGVVARLGETRRGSD